jgi:hypothetical protein
MSAETQVRAWTPLVIEVSGPSSGGRSGHRALNMRRLTAPWSADTPFDMPARRRPMTAMLNGLWAGSSGTWPRAMSSSKPMPHSSAQLRK